jgi:hypothetical protein
MLKVIKTLLLCGLVAVSLYAQPIYAQSLFPMIGVGVTRYGIGFDAASHSPGLGSSGTFTESWNHTVGTNSNRLLLVWAGTYAQHDVTGVTYNGKSGTLINTAAGGHADQALWAFVNPDSGTHAVVVTIGASGGEWTMSSAMSFYGVDQVRPIQQSVLVQSQGANASGTITTIFPMSGATPTSWVADGYFWGNSITPSSPTWSLKTAAVSGAGVSVAGATTGPVVGSNTDTWTANAYGHAGVLVELKAATPMGTLGITNTYTLNGVAYIDVRDGYLYSTANAAGGLWITDLATNATSSYVNASCDMEGVRAVTSTVYVACKSQGTIEVIDTTNKASPSLITTISDSRLSNVSGLAINASGTALYATSGSGKLVVFDISSPSSPVIVGSALGLGYGEYLNGTILFTGRGGLTAYDVSVPSAPAVLGSIPAATFGGCTTESAWGNYASVVYVACQSPNQIVPVDVSNPSAMVIGSPLSLPAGVTPWWTAGDSSYLYVNDPGTGHLLAYNVHGANPLAAPLVDILGNGAGFGDDMRVINGFIYNNGYVLQALH